MPTKLLIQYMLAKYKKQTRKENYMFDCLWAMATGMQFRDEDGNVTLPRFHEIGVVKQIEESEETLSPKETVLEIFRRNKE